MTRPIEFRAQRADTGEFVYGDLVKNSWGCFIIEHFSIDNGKIVSSIQHQVIPETVGQFTGLLDRNGKKIFEGDVLTWRCSKSGSTYEKNYTVVIEWPINAHSYSIVILDKKKRFATQRTYWNEAYREVIGTIHDKPEKP